MSLPDAGAIVGGLAVAVYGIFGRRPFYNDVEHPLSDEERSDSCPPILVERCFYIAFGLCLFSFGLWKLVHPE